VDRDIKRQTSALVEAGMILASELDLESLLQRIADLSREVVGARYGAVGVLGDEGDLVRFVYSGIDHATADLIGDLPTGRGVLGALIEEGKPLRMREIGEHPRSYGFPEHHPPMHTFLGVPIIVRGRVFGRLYVTEKQSGDEFSKDDERIALTLATQAGIAIENSRLYEEIRARTVELAQRLAELSSVERVGRLVTSEESIDEVLGSAAEEAVNLTGAKRAIVTLLDRTTNELVIRAEAGADIERVVGVRLQEGRSKNFSVLGRGVGEVVEDLGVDTEIDAMTTALLGNPVHGAFVPMAVRNRAVGTIAVYDRTDRRPFDQDDLVILQMLANQLAIAVENDRLTQSLQALAVLEERERISKELHDGVIQSIYSVGLSLQGTMSLLERDPALAETRIDGVIAQLDNVVRDVRSYIFELQPMVVEGRSFGEAVAELARDLEVNTLATVSMDLPEEACGDLDKNQRSNLIQIVREIFSNIARHGEATELTVSCRREGDRLTLQVDDNGRGFDPESVIRGHGLGNMEARSRTMGGELSLYRLKPTGMRHVVSLPLT
jgi:signal transduction histidine kinase